jgi:hypothetical protein
MSEPQTYRYTTPIRGANHQEAPQPQQLNPVGQPTSTTPVRSYRPMTGAVSDRRVTTPIRNNAGEQNKESQSSLPGVVMGTAYSQTTSYYMTSNSSAGLTPDRLIYGNHQPNEYHELRKDIVPERLFSTNNADFRKNSGSATLIHTSTYIEQQNPALIANQQVPHLGNLSQAVIIRGNASPGSSAKSSGIYRPLISGTNKMGSSGEYGVQLLRKSNSPTQNMHVAGKLSGDSVYHNGTEAITPQNLFT